MKHQLILGPLLLALFSCRKEPHTFRPSLTDTAYIVEFKANGQALHFDNMSDVIDGSYLPGHIYSFVLFRHNHSGGIGFDIYDSTFSSGWDTLSYSQGDYYSFGDLVIGHYGDSVNSYRTYDTPYKGSMNLYMEADRKFITGTFSFRATQYNAQHKPIGPDVEITEGRLRILSSEFGL